MDDGIISGHCPCRSAESACAICLDSIKAGQGQALFTAECLHIFHFSCIAFNVRYGNQICPICRAKWKDLPWQAGFEGLRNESGQNSSLRGAASSFSSGVSVSRSYTFSDYTFSDSRNGNALYNPPFHYLDESALNGPVFSEEPDWSYTFSDSRNGNAFFNPPLQYLDESASNGPVFPEEPDCYDDDEPVYQSRMSDFPSGSTSSGFCRQQLHLQMFAEVSAVPQYESRQSFTVLVHLRAPAVGIANIYEGCDPPSQGNPRAPLDLVAVLDISGSMAGRKLLLLKQAMSFVICNLSAADRLSVVVFSSTASRIFPLRRMGEDGQRQALQAVDTLLATGDTNIFEGLRKGVKVLDERKEKNSVSSILLLSDGQDTTQVSELRFFHTQGTPDMQSLAPQSIRRSASSNQMPIPVHTFGFGSDHDALTMHTIADVSGGTFSYIQKEEGVQDAFAQCIGGLLSVVAQAVQLTVRCSAPDVFISDIHSGSYDNSILEDARHGIVKIGDLYAEEERDVLVDLKLPSLLKSEEPVTMSVLQASCTYKDPLKQDVIQNAADELTITRPVLVEEGYQNLSLEVDRHRNRLQTTKSIAEARALADQGNIEAAQCGLRNARAQLGASPSAHAGDRLCHALESELDEIKKRMANLQLYERSGRAYTLSAVSCHSRQRATTRGDSVDSSMHDYQTPSMDDMVSSSRAW